MNLSICESAIFETSILQRGGTEIYWIDGAEFGREMHPKHIEQRDHLEEDAFAGEAAGEGHPAAGGAGGVAQEDADAPACRLIDRA